MGKAGGAVLWALVIMALVGTSHIHAADDPGRLSRGKETVIATVKVGRCPHGVTADEGTHRVYVANLNSGSVSVIDSIRNKVITTIEVGKKPRDVAVNPRTHRIYVPDMAVHSMSTTRWLGLRFLRPVFTVSVIDDQTYDTLAHVPVGIAPWLIGVNEKTNRIYVANYSSYNVSVIDGESQEVVATIDMGLFRTPWDIAVNQETNLVYIVSTFHLGSLDLGAGRLLIIDGDTNEVLSTLRVGREAHVAVNERTNRVYVVSRHSGTLVVIDGHTHEPIATLNVVGPDPYGLAVNEAANRVYVANHGGQSVSVVDGEKNELLYTVDVGVSPGFVAVSEATGRVYVTNSGDDTVSVLDSIMEVSR